MGPATAFDPRKLISRPIFNGVRMVPQPDPENVERMDMSVLPLLCHMERVGMPIDRGHIESLHKQLTQEMDRLQAEITRLSGHSINPGSGDQTADLLFRTLGLKQQGKQKWTKSKARLAADSDVLTAMLSKHACIKPILDWRVAEKLRSTYTYSLLAQLDENGRCHPDYAYTVAETGRIACREPNLTNIPVRTKLGQEVRKAFVAPKGMVVGSIDMSQIESRHAGWDAQCTNLFSVYSEGKDLYWDAAERVFKRTFTAEARESGRDEKTGLTLKEVFRQAAKVIVLATLYDISPEGLVDQLIVFGAIPFLTGGESTTWDYDRYYTGAVAKCAEAIRGFGNGYPEVIMRRREHHRRARRYRLSWDCWGRTRPIPQVRSVHPYIQAEGLRAAGNMPVQAGCAGILKLWVSKLHEIVLSKYRKSNLSIVNIVHDEAILLGPERVMRDFLPEAAETLKTLLPPEVYNMPLKASYDYSHSWGTIKK